MIMDKNIYVIIWRTELVVETSVFSSRESADENFEKLKDKFGLTEKDYYQCHYEREAYGFGYAKTASGHGQLVLAKKILNFCSI